MVFLMYHNFIHPTIANTVNTTNKDKKTKQNKQSSQIQPQTTDREAVPRGLSQSQTQSQFYKLLHFFCLPSFFQNFHLQLLPSSILTKAGRTEIWIMSRLLRHSRLGIGRGLR
jgi:hypothetical protein